MQWLATAAIILSAILGTGLLAFVVLIFREWSREGGIASPEEEMFGALRPPEPPPLPGEFVE